MRSFLCSSATRCSRFSPRKGPTYRAKPCCSTGAASSTGGLKKEIVKGRAAVDASCPIADECHIYEQGSEVYDALLNQTDIGANKNK